VEFPRLTQALAHLARLYPRQTITPALLDAYVHELHDLPIGDVEAGIRVIARSSRWFPTVAEIREAAATLSLDLPGDAEALTQLEAYVTAINRRRTIDCAACEGRGEVPVTPGQPGDGPMQCGECNGTGEQWDTKLPALHPTVRETLDLIGGYRGYIDAAEPTVVRGQFLRLHRAIAARQTRDRQVGEIPSGPLHPAVARMAPDLPGLPA
jgi:hypothetical protein